VTLAALSSQARAAQRQAEALAERDRALLDLVAVLDPHGTRVAWQVAGEVAGLLRRFMDTPYRRIVSGHRGPRGDIEPLLLSLVEGACPTSQKRIHALLRELVTSRVSNRPLESGSATDGAPDGNFDLA
jgi:hypothetical protein